MKWNFNFNFRIHSVGSSRVPTSLRWIEMPSWSFQLNNWSKRNNWMHWDDPKFQIMYRSPSFFRLIWFRLLFVAITMIVFWPSMICFHSVVCKISIARHRNDLHSCLNCRNWFCYSHWPTTLALLCQPTSYHRQCDHSANLLLCQKCGLLFVADVRSISVRVYVQCAQRPKRDYLLVYSVFFSPSASLQISMPPTPDDKRLSIIFCVILPMHWANERRASDDLWRNAQNRKDGRPGRRRKNKALTKSKSALCVCVYPR